MYVYMCICIYIYVCVCVCGCGCVCGCVCVCVCKKVITIEIHILQNDMLYMYIKPVLSNMLHQNLSSPTCYIKTCLLQHATSKLV